MQHYAGVVEHFDALFGDVALHAGHGVSCSHLLATHCLNSVVKCDLLLTLQPCMQVGCPEGRIDENVAKLTAAGYKVSNRPRMLLQIVSLAICNPRLQLDEMR